MIRITDQVRRALGELLDPNKGGWTREQIAEAVGLKRKETVSDWMSGKTANIRESHYRELEVLLQPYMPQRPRMAVIRERFAELFVRLRPEDREDVMGIMAERAAFTD